ncbi:MAG: hypothetical protein IJ728_05525, partial [Selenomonadaceae bacterium]|nr:hypothetical protein [Selenomonadaceae bacterium]
MFFHFYLPLSRILSLIYCPSKRESRHGDYCGVKSPKIEVKEVEIEVPASNNVDIEKVAILARKYESNGDPACVANNP